VVAVNLDQKQPGFPEHVLPEYLTKRGVPFYILEKDTYSIVKELTPEGKTYCAVCSRLRRGNLYAFAQEIGATKVALGHHRDDILATLFLNMFHGGKLKAMPPKLLSDDGKNILIRPLAYCKEKDIVEFARLKEFRSFPAISAAHRKTCSVLPSMKCCGSGIASFHNGWTPCSLPYRTWHRHNWPIASCLILSASRQLLITPGMCLKAALIWSTCLFDDAHAMST
jgi:hypothetical protein